MIELSQRVQALPGYPLAEIPTIKRRLIEQGMDVIDLGAGDNDTPPPDIAVQTLSEALRDPAYSKYGFQHGIPAFRKAASRWVERRFGQRLLDARERGVGEARSDGARELETLRSAALVIEWKRRDVAARTLSERRDGRATARKAPVAQTGFDRVDQEPRPITRVAFPLRTERGCVAPEQTKGAEDLGPCDGRERRQTRIDRAFYVRQVCGRSTSERDAIACAVQEIGGVRREASVPRYTPNLGSVNDDAPASRALFRPDDRAGDCSRQVCN